MSRTEPDKPVLVVGAGYVGGRFLECQQRGRAFGLSRSPVASKQAVHRLDLDTDTMLPVPLPNRYALLYTAPPSQNAANDVRLERLLGMLDPAPVRLVYISTTGVYGNRDGARVDEETPVSPGSDRAARRCAAEDQLLAWSKATHTAIVILRVPGIYGPGRLGTHQLRSGAPVIAEGDIGPGNRIHVDDLVSCCEAALSDDTPEGIYNVGDGDHRSATWFKNELAKQLGMPAPRSISMNEAAETFSEMAMSFLRESRIVDTQKMRDVLGVTPRYPNAEDGIRASLEEELN